MNNIKQEIRCGQGNHNWIKIGNVTWCKFCGTLITKSFGLTDDDFVVTTEEIHYPEYPHYLPKEESKDEETNKEDKALDVDA